MMSKLTGHNLSSTVLQTASVPWDVQMCRDKDFFLHTCVNNVKMHKSIFKLLEEVLRTDVNTILASFEDTNDEICGKLF